MKQNLAAARKNRDSGERGNASAEFVMVSGLVVLMFVLILQIAFAIYTKNILVDAASSGARYGSLLDRTPADGVTRAQELVSHNLPSSYVTSVSYTETVVSGAPVLEIHISGALPVLGPFGFERGLEVTGHAIMQQ